MSLCECGCGKETKLADRQRRDKRGVLIRRGDPQRYLSGHNRIPRPISDPAARFWSKVDKSDPAGCWIFTGRLKDDGYGQYKLSQPRRTVGAHRYAYELVVGVIPEGLHLDHLCRVKSCVNPAHLEPVTPAENQRRASQRVLGECRKGHPIRSDADLYISPKGIEDCAVCRRERSRRNARKAA